MSARSQDDEPTIPVIVDSVKRSRGFAMTRCAYFSIQCDGPAPDCDLGIRGARLPILMIGLGGIVHRPMQGDRFETVDKLQDLFDRIEGVQGLYVDQDDLWLPNTLLGEEGPKRGEVFRVSIRLFEAAYRFRNGAIGQEEFEQICAGQGVAVLHSPDETRTFAEWAQAEIATARQTYHANRKEYLTRPQP
jgi:hypothetical protein